MVIIPKQNLVHDAMETGEIIQEDREYIGYSGIGGECQRRIWYTFRWCWYRSVTKRSQRIFDRGHLEENRVIQDMIKIGMDVTDTQVEVVDETGHVKGHIDGIAHNVPGSEKTPHLLEVKTMNDKRFKDYKNKGIKLTDWAYWVQIQMYMGRLNLKRCLFIVTNKNNEERDYQRYKFDRGIYQDYNGIAFNILSTEEPPKKIGQKTWHVCKMCDAKDICHNNAPIRKTCRTCKHFEIEMGGRFFCGMKVKELSKLEQLNACPAYQLLETL